MLLITCPFCGPRAEVEFRHGGEAHLTRPQPDCSDEEWAAYLYMRANVRGLQAERWSHARGCGQFFNALRDTQTDAILATYRRDVPRATMVRLDLLLADKRDQSQARISSVSRSFAIFRTTSTKPLQQGE